MYVIGYKKAVAVGTGAVTLVTGANYDAVIGIRLCNILTSTIEVDVYIVNSGNKYLAKQGRVLALLYILFSMSGLAIKIKLSLF